MYAQDNNSLPVWIILSPAHQHISINSQPFLVGIVSRSMELKVQLPIKVQVDNVGAIWLANVSSVSERTKHDDLRAHFVRNMIKDQVIEINFVKSAENDSDIMTKNQREQHYMYAKSKLVYTVQEMNEKKDIQDEETGRMLES